MSPRTAATILHVGTVLALTAASSGCAAPQRLSVNANRYRLEVRLDPVEHRLTGRAVMDLERVGTGSWIANQPAAIDLLLHPDLDIRALRIAGASIKRRSRPRPARFAEGDERGPLRHRIILERPVDRLTVFVDFEGRLFQDVSAGEVEGQIHNFEMQTHIAAEGVYLGGAYWYPEPVADEDAPPGRKSLISNFVVMSLRCQASIVSGLTMLAISAGAFFLNRIANFRQHVLRSPSL